MRSVGPLLISACEHARSHPNQDLGDRGRGAPSSPVQSIEGRERGEDPDHVLGFPDRTSRPEPVVRGQPLGKSVIGFGLLGLSSMARQPPVQDRIRRPRRAGPFDSQPEVCRRVRPGFCRRGLRGGPKLRRKRLEQPGFGPELVVNRDPGHSRLLRHLADSGFRAKLGYEAASSVENACSCPLDFSGPPRAQAVPSGTHSTLD